MFTVFRHAFSRYRGQILGWGLSLGLLALWLVSFYDALAVQGEQLRKLFESYPKEVFAFFGGMTDFLSPEGFINVELFSYMPLVLGIFAVMAGSGLLVADEEKGVLDLVAAHPVSRRDLFFGRLLALTAAILAILALMWLGILIGMQWSTNMNLGWGEVWLPHLSLLAYLLLFACIALFLSMVLPSRRMAAMTAGVLLVASFFITGMAQLNPDVKKIADLMPMTYYQGGLAVTGLNMGWFGGLMVAAVIFALLAWCRFERRDIRVGGEGGWRLPSLRMRRRSVES